MTTAPELSTAEAAKVGEFDAAPEPPEIVVERVGRAIWEAEGRHPDDWGSSPLRAFVERQEHIRLLARAAIAALDPS